MLFCHTLCVVWYHLGFAVVLSGSEIPCVLLSEFLGYMHFISCGINELLTCFGAIHM
jgi:hypothetical protein